MQVLMFVGFILAIAGISISIAQRIDDMYPSKRKS